jgi:hypothetical protein
VRPVATCGDKFFLGLVTSSAGCLAGMTLSRRAQSTRPARACHRAGQKPLLGRPDDRLQVPTAASLPTMARKQGDRICHVSSTGRAGRPRSNGSRIWYYNTICAQILWKRTNFGIPNEINAVRFPRRGGSAPLPAPQSPARLRAPHRAISRPSRGIATSPRRGRSRFTAPHSTAWLLLTTGLPRAASSSSMASI